MEYAFDEAAKLIIKAGHELVKKGYIARTWGNISARLSDSEFLITPSGIAYEDLTPDKLVACTIEDCNYDADVKPSSEKGVHAAAYQQRPDCNFVIHTHQLYATAVGAAGETVYGRDDNEKALLGTSGVPCAKYGISSTKKLTMHMSECMKENPSSNIFFMRYHGVLSLGEDYEQCFSRIELLEDICRVLINICGCAPHPKRKDMPSLNFLKQKAIIVDDSDYAVLASAGGKKLFPISDDMAQIAGVSFACIDPDDKEFDKKISKALKSSDAVFVKDCGAICVAKEQEECEAIEQVLDKNCLAYLYCKSKGQNKHIGAFDAKLQRTVYKFKYSKLK